MSYSPNNPNGNNTAANSAPVTLASDNNGPVKITDGTNTVNVLKSDGTAAGQNAELVANTYLSQTFSVSSVTAGTAYDVGNYRSVSVQVTAMYTGTTPTITWQGSNDGVNWGGVRLVGTGTFVTDSSSTTSPGIWSGNLHTRYFRLNFTGAYTSGASTGTIVFSTGTDAAQSASVSAQQSGTWTVGSNSATGSAKPANAFLMGLDDGTNLVTWADLQAKADATSGINIGAVGPWVFNGTSWDRQRSATSAKGTTGIGVLAAGALGFDGTNYQAIKTSTTGVVSVDGSAVTQPVSGTVTANTPLPAAAALADGASNPTAPAVGGFGMVYNGATWERMRGDLGDGSGATGLLVNSGLLYNGSTYDRARSATGAGTGTQAVSQTPATAGGLSISRVLSAATTNATSVKASAGQVYGWSIFNTSAATKFVKLYNKASAPTVGTDTPVMTVPIPAGGGSNISLDSGIAFATGIALAITGVVTDADTTAVAANDVICNLLYK